MRRMVLISIAVLVMTVAGGSAALIVATGDAQPAQPTPELVETTNNHPVAYLGNREAPPSGNVVNEVNEDPLPELPPKPHIEHPNLGYSLDQKASQQQEQQAGGSESRSEVETDGASETTAIPVIIHLSGNVDGVVTFLEDNGGDPRNTGDDYIEAYVPVSLLGELSEQPGVFRVRELIPAHTR